MLNKTWHCTLSRSWQTGNSLFWFEFGPNLSLISVNLSGRIGRHTGFKRLKPTGNKFTQSDFTSFNKKVSANLHYFRFRSLPGLHIQICQIVTVAIMIRQFHEFFESSIWRVFDNWPNCALWWHLCVREWRSTLWKNPQLPLTLGSDKDSIQIYRVCKVYLIVYVLSGQEVDITSQ